MKCTEIWEEEGSQKGLWGHGQRIRPPLLPTASDKRGGEAARTSITRQSWSPLFTIFFSVGNPISTYTTEASMSLADNNIEGENRSQGRAEEEPLSFLPAHVPSNANCEQMGPR